MKKINQKGMGHLGLLLLIVVVAVVALVGWKVWDDHHNNNVYVAPANPAAIPAEPSASSTKTDNTHYLVVKQWGVKIPLTSSLSSISYQMNDANSAVFYVRVSDPAGKVCLTDVAVDRGLASQDVPAGAQGGTFKKYYQQLGNSFFLDSGGYYYTPPGEVNGVSLGCGKDEAAAKQNLTLAMDSYPKLLKAASAQTDALNNALNHMKQQ